MPLLVEIQATATWQQALPSLPALTRRTLQAVLAEMQWLTACQAEVGVIFTTDPKIRTLNRNWRGKDKATNVLSFPQLSAADLKKGPRAKTNHALPLGDLVLAYQTTKQEAKAANKALKAHVAHLLVHGMLHLLGYDHETNATAAARMEKIEIKIMRTLGYDNPYLNYDH